LLPQACNLVGRDILFGDGDERLVADVGSGGEARVLTENDLIEEEFHQL